jgi:hypothetical protein
VRAPKIAPERAAAAVGADRARVEARLWREHGHRGAAGAAANAPGGAGRRDIKAALAAARRAQKITAERERQAGTSMRARMTGSSHGRTPITSMAWQRRSHGSSASVPTLRSRGRAIVS